MTRHEADIGGKITGVLVDLEKARYLLGQNSKEVIGTAAMLVEGALIALTHVAWSIEERLVDGSGFVGDLVEAALGQELANEAANQGADARSAPE